MGVRITVPLRIPPDVMRKPDYDPGEDNVVDKAEAPRSGAAFPADAQEGEIFYRTDLKGFYMLVNE